MMPPSNYTPAVFCLIFDIVGSTSSFTSNPQNFTTELESFVHEISILLKEMIVQTNNNLDPIVNVAENPSILLSKFTGDGFMFLIKETPGTDQNYMEMFIETLVFYTYAKKPTSKLFKGDNYQKTEITSKVHKMNLRAALDIDDPQNLKRIENSFLNLNDQLGIILNRTSRICQEIKGLNGPANCFLINETMTFTTPTRNWAYTWLPNRNMSREITGHHKVVIQGKGIGSINVLPIRTGNSYLVKSGTALPKSDIDAMEKGKSFYVVHIPNFENSGYDLHMYHHYDLDIKKIFSI